MVEIRDALLFPSLPTAQETSVPSSLLPHEVVIPGGDGTPQVVRMAKALRQETLAATDAVTMTATASQMSRGWNASSLIIPWP
jgi:hypothetical protein